MERGRRIVGSCAKTIGWWNMCSLDIEKESAIENKDGAYELWKDPDKVRDYLAKRMEECPGCEWLKQFESLEEAVTAWCDEVSGGCEE